VDVTINGTGNMARGIATRLLAGGQGDRHRSGGSRAIDGGPLRRARELERLGFPGMTFQQPLGLNFQSAWKLIS
jgi:predicted dinucleotide-binding enzyme